jgi:hypothetical protein
MGQENDFMRIITEFNGNRSSTSKQAPLPKVHLIRIPKASSSSISAIARRLVGCNPPGPCCRYPGNPKVCTTTLGALSHVSMSPSDTLLLSLHLNPHSQLGLMPSSERPARATLQMQCQSCRVHSSLPPPRRTGKAPREPACKPFHDERAHLTLPLRIFLRTSS